MEKEIMLSSGELTIPVKINESDFGVQRLVLTVHGLGGSSADSIQASIAEEMEFFGSAVYRFDFPTHGVSPLNGEYFTLKNCRESLMAVVRYARKCYPEVEDLCIFATGFGAYVTLTCLEDIMDMPGKLKLVLQTPSVRMHETLLSMIGISRATLEAMGRIDSAWQRQPDVTFEFYQELENNVVMMAYPLPMLILHGEEDSVIRYEDIENFVRINDQSKLVIIPGASHRFQEPGAWDMVLDLTRDWFELEQVLLSDWS
ncbi:MAG: alpha/beta hydrolase [Oscillospiraceae bacterium]|nr:alpha/beta hydrolase [Oscillospiraceae bacterium]